MFLVTLPRFCFRKKASKTLDFQISLPLKEPLMATFSETCAPTSTKYVYEIYMTIPNLSETLQLFGRTPPFLH